MTTPPPSTHLPSPSPSPTRSHFSPLKHDPNPHPYAIKTTSTALLTRSNSSPHAAQQGRHYYVPLSRSRAGSICQESPGVAPSPIPIPIPSKHVARRHTTHTTTSPALLPPPNPPLPTQHPKTWSPTLLSTYLQSALLLSRSGHPLPERVARDISAWVRSNGIGGERFLSLGEGDLEG
jgi:hypothetical protein